MLAKGVHAYRQPTQKSVRNFEFLKSIHSEFPRKNIKPRTLRKLGVTIIEPNPSGKVLSANPELRKLSAHELEQYLKPKLGKHALHTFDAAITGVAVYGREPYRKRVVLLLDEQNHDLKLDYRRLTAALPNFPVDEEWKPHLTIAETDISFATSDVLEWAATNAPEKVVLGPLQYRFPVRDF